MNPFSIASMKAGLSGMNTMQNLMGRVGSLLTETAGEGARDDAVRAQGAPKNADEAKSTGEIMKPEYIKEKSDAPLSLPVTDEKAIETREDASRAAFSKERDAVQSAAYAMAQSSPKDVSARALRGKMDAAIKAEAEAAVVDPIIAKHLSDITLRSALSAKGMQARTDILEGGLIADKTRQRDALTAHEAVRMSGQLADPQITARSKQFQDEARGNDRRLNPEILRSNMSIFLAERLKATKAECVKSKDKQGTIFTTAAIKRLSQEGKKPTTMKTLAVIAYRTAEIAGKRNPDAAKPFVAAQFSLLHADKIQRAKAKRLDQVE